MAKEKQIYTQTFNGGISTDTAEELLPPNVYRSALNIRVVSTGNGNQGIVTNIKGNVLIEFPLPAGENYTVGSENDTENNKFYYLNYNSEGYHGVYQYDALLNTVQTVLQSKTDSGDIDILRFTKEALILHIDIIDGNISWCDGVEPARRFSIAKALDKSATGYGLVIQEEFINAYKLAPIFAPSLSYFTDTTRLTNYMQGKLFKASQRHLFDYKEYSNWSEYSVVPLPDIPINSVANTVKGAAAISNLNNGLKITVETGSAIVDKIEIAIQYTIPEGESLFESIITLDKTRLGISDNTTYDYTFYNDNVSYSGLDQAKVIRAFSYLPDKPSLQAFTDNAIVFGGGTEGFEPVDIDVSVEVTYGDLFLSNEVETELNDPQFVGAAVPGGAYYVPYINPVNNLPNGHSRDNTFEITIGNDVKKGNKFDLLIYNGQRDYLPFTYTATVTDDSTTVANEFRKLLVATGRVRMAAYGDIPFVDIYNTTSGVDNIKFSFVFKGLQFNRLNEPYDEISATVNPISTQTLKDNGQSIGTHKSGGTGKYAWVYWDESTKRSLSYTSDEAFVRTDFVTETDGYKKVTHLISTKHQPPIWAKYWELARTVDLTYGDWVHVMVQEAIESQTTEDTEYIDLVIDGFYTYQRIHTDTVVAFDFQKNDRVRLIRKEDGSGSDSSNYYEFYETVVLDVKTYVEEIKTEDVVTTNGGTTVTVGSPVSSDNIDRFISIDGVERKIIGATGTTYTLERPISMGTVLTYPTYKIIDRRNILRVRKPIDIVIEDNSLIEVYKPTVSVQDSEKNFYLFGQKYDILNWGTADRAHAGNVQDQDPNDLSGTPSIVKITKGTSYVRNRELPTNNIVPETQVLIDLIEDAGYSDYYSSKLNDNGKVSPEDNGLGVVRFGDRLRFSNNYISGTGINGLSDFDNLDRKDYNDTNGDFARIIYTEKILMAWKRLKTGYIPIYATLIQDERSQSLLGASKKLLNDIQYFTHDGGIGNNPESIYRNESWFFFASANSGTFCRTGGDGILPISEQFGVDTTVEELLRNAAKFSTRIFGGGDGNEYQPCFEQYNEYNYNGGFDPTWTLTNPELHEDTIYEVTTNAINGDAATPVGKFITYTPDTDFVGDDYFYYRWMEPLGAWSSPKKQCISVVEPPVIPTNPTYYNVELITPFIKDNCVSGDGTAVNYVVPAATFSSPYSQEAADQQAIDDTNANGQAYANEEGSCFSGGIEYNVITTDARSIANSGDLLMGIVDDTSSFTVKTFSYTVGNPPYSSTFTVINDANGLQLNVQNFTELPLVIKLYVNGVLEDTETVIVEEGLAVTLNSTVKGDINMVIEDVP